MKILIIIIILFMAIPLNAEEKVIDTKFIMISSYLVAMTVFDVETTFAVIRNGGHEANPIMKPFVKSGRFATYGLQFGIDALAILLAHEIKGSKYKALKDNWWVIPSVIGTGHAIAGGLNLRYVW